MIDENGLPTKVYSWDYQRPFDKCWFRVFSAAFAWIDGQMAHVITSVDIDHQKTIEEELRIAKEKAENLDRLKSAFLANMSHEIRTPLNAIVGFASLLVESDDKKERQDYVDIMQENTELLLQLISDILDLSKIEAGTLDFTMDYLDIKSFCEDIIRNYDIKEDKPVPVLLAPTLPNFYIYTDKKRLMQVITNFINNALKFTNKGQILLEYHLKEDTSEIEFSVADTGMGIRPLCETQFILKRHRLRAVYLQEHYRTSRRHYWSGIRDGNRLAFLVYSSLPKRTPIKLNKKPVNQKKA